MPSPVNSPRWHWAGGEMGQVLFTPLLGSRASSDLGGEGITKASSHSPLAN